MIEHEWEIIERMNPEERKLRLGRTMKVLDIGRVIDNIELEDAKKDWKKVYSNFLRSKEWNTFKNLILKERKYKCKIKGCKNKDLMVHHLIKTRKIVIKEGFLKPLENKKNFEVVCRKHHED